MTQDDVKYWLNQGAAAKREELSVQRSRHVELLDAVNDAKTQAEHDMAYWKLQGWRDGLEYCNRRWDFIEADQHAFEKYGDRPVCCGVLLDWLPVPSKEGMPV